MQPRLAVLIDAENVGARNWPRIREHISTLGSIAVCKVFGNLTEERLAGWLKIANDEALQPVLQFSGANACDIGITVAAMDLLYTSRLEGFCLVSSDGDFTSLVHRLRGAGLKVYGVGNSKSAPRLGKACTDFVTVTELLKSVVVPKAA
ncbi:MAG TPA: NYN domain-containing protein [Devosia sp.]|nr:NYN domain-containing protein [Devosia sp.]